MAKAKVYVLDHYRKQAKRQHPELIEKLEEHFAQAGLAPSVGNEKRRREAEPAYSEYFLKIESAVDDAD